MIPEERLKHSLKVAELMREFVADHPEQFRIKSDEAFVLGFVHDIGCAFCDEHKHLHSLIGGVLLKAVGFKYWREVLAHGDPNSLESSPELHLLNYVDMQVSPTGRVISFGERLNDIIARYGENSPQYVSSEEIIERNPYAKMFGAICEQTE